MIAILSQRVGYFSTRAYASLNFAASPESAHAISIETFVGTHNWNNARKGLSDEHAIEGILMQSAQTSGSDGMLYRDRQFDKSLFLNLPVQTVDQFPRSKFANLAFNRQFPSGRRRNEHNYFSIFDNFPSLAGELISSLEPPNERARVY